MFHSYDWHNYLIHFNISGPLYYVALYVQVMLAAPFLYLGCQKACAASHPLLRHLLNFGLLYLAAVFLNQHTNVLDIILGGGILFGGSYLLLFYIGLLFFFYKERLQSGRSWLHLLISGAALCLWLVFLLHDKGTMEPLKSPNGAVNPPGVEIIVYAVLVAMTIFYAVAILEKIQNRWVCGVLFVMAELGKYSLYIFLYHMLISAYFLARFEAMLTNIWGKRMLYLLCMVMMPVAMGICLKKGKAFLLEAYRGSGKEATDKQQ